ncbi:hypothetical protein E2N91_21830 [Pseudomonas syringae pv. tomato]|nr:hypothetical protein DND90_28005 [Pseudomonas syringae pv. maculicola]TES55298.1 hypothetical protein E2N91_21830 [Pseudomonas syringae pv. tomato]
MAIIGGGHVGVELIKRRNEFVDYPFFSMAFVVEDRDQTGSAIEFPVRAFRGAKPNVREMVNDNVAYEP